MLTWEYNEEAVKRVLYNEAHAEGRAEGREEGREEEKYSIARKLKNTSILPITEIATITGLSVEEVEVL